LCFLALALIAAPVFAADPVKATVTFTGAKTPGTTNTAKAVLTISDGSTLQSIQWTQTGGVPVVLANALTDTVTITLPDIKAFRTPLVKYLHESPVTTSQLPTYYPPGRQFENGLQERWTVAGVYPTPIANAAAIKFTLHRLRGSPLRPILSQPAQRACRQARAAARQDPGHLRLDAEGPGWLEGRSHRGQYVGSGVHAGHRRDV
jgi:hypothetical protein